MRMRTPRAAALGLLAVVLTLGGCGGGAADDGPGAAARPPGDGPLTITVPGDAATISAAVAVARPGDLVLVRPGVYRETVRITTEGVTLRGTDRAGVVIDGEVRRPHGVVVTAPDVTVQNLTVRGATLNGVLVTGMSDEHGGLARGSDGYTRLDPAKFPPLRGFHVDHVTAYNNGLYGIYAFDAQYGLIENSYTSGMADSGIYVGQCKPCHIVVRGNVAERNAVGYEGTNASGAMVVTGNRFTGNRVGATTNSDYQEALVPQQDAVFAGNLVSGNNARDTPEQADGGFGVGFAVAGGTGNQVVRNLIEHNTVAGLVLTSAADLAPTGNQITGNQITGNGTDLAYTATAAAPGSGNCLRDNTFASSLPPGLGNGAGCAGGPVPPPGADLAPGPAPRGIPFTDVAAPPPQPSLPAPGGPPPRWSPGDLVLPRLDDIALPGADLLAPLAAAGR